MNIQKLKKLHDKLFTDRSPQKGRTKELYDRFVNNPMQPVEIEHRRDSSVINNLKVFYGLDIRNVSPRNYACFGTNQRDFLNERVMKEDIYECA